MKLKQPSKTWINKIFCVFFFFLLKFVCLCLHQLKRQKQYRTCGCTVDLLWAGSRHKNAIQICIKIALHCWIDFPYCAIAAMHRRSTKYPTDAGKEKVIAPQGNAISETWGCVPHVVALLFFLSQFCSSYLILFSQSTSGHSDINSVTLKLMLCPREIGGAESLVASWRATLPGNLTINILASLYLAPAN